MVISHRMMLADKERCKTYQHAIEAVIRKGNTVLDLGTGSGLLAYFAVQAGAKKVYAIEQTPIIEWAKKICAVNNWQNKIEFIRGNSSDIVLSEKVDVIISELIGLFGLEEDLLKYLVDARNRFLKDKGGIFLPYNLKLFLAPVTAETIYSEKIDFWNELYGIKYSPARHQAVNTRHLSILGTNNFLAVPQQIHNLDFYTMSEKDIYLKSRCEYKIESIKDKTMHGLLGWFIAGMAPGIELTTAPGKRPTHWENSFFPIEEPITVKKGDLVKVVFSASPFRGSVCWIWEVEVIRKNRGIKKYKQSTFKSVTIDNNVLSKQKEDVSAKLSLKGARTSHVLGLMRKKMTAREIVGDLLKHDALEFLSEQEAREFVSKNIISYGI